jgi:outer membrane protein
MRVVPLCTLGALAALVLGGGTAAGETLTEALAMAYRGNPQLLSERARLRATDEQVPQALANWRPTVQVTGSAGITRTDTSGRGGNSGTTLSGANGITGSGSGTQIVRSHDYQMTISQPLYRGGRSVAQTAEAENLVRAERATLLATEQTILLNAATAFMDVVRDQALLDLQIENEQILRDLLRATQAQLRAGTALDTDVQLAQGRLSTAIAGRQTAEANLATSRETYRLVIGQAPQRLDYPPERPVLPVNGEEAKQLASIGNPNVVAAQFTRAAAMDAVGVVRGQLLPTLSLNGTASRSVASQSGDRTTDELSVTAQVSMPLYEAGTIYSQTREAKETVSQRTHDLETAQRQAVQQAGAAWEALVSGRATIVSNQDAVRAEEAALRGIQAQYRAGTRSIIDVLNETQNLLNNRINLANALHNEPVAAFQLATAVGRLTALDLKLPVDLYDANAHYDTVRGKWHGLDASK